MPIKYDHDKERNSVYSNPSGIISKSDISKYFDEVAEDPNVANDFIEIVNRFPTINWYISY